MAKTVILAAEEAEYRKCLEYFPDYECIRTGVGAGNVIKTCHALDKGTGIVNVGYAGSNLLDIGTVTAVSSSFRYMKGEYIFTDHANPLRICDEGYPCYTNNDFVTESDIADPVLFDMELNYIAAFSPALKTVLSIKIVSDNLSIDDFRNNGLRESGILTCDEVWKKVRELFDRHIGGR